MKNMFSESIITIESYKDFMKKINWSNYIIYFVFVGIFLFFSIALSDKGFFSTGNIMNIVLQTSIISIMAVGMTFVLSAAEIDLSFGAVVAFAALSSALVLRHTDSLVLSILVGLCAGTLVGVINGFFTTYVGIPSFLVTLGMTGIVKGVSRWMAGLQAIPMDNSTFKFIFGAGKIGTIPVLFIWMFLITFAGAVLLKKTVFGREVLAVGGNKISANYSGIKVGKIKMQVLVLNAFLASLAGILYSGRNYGAKYTLGENDLMIVIAAVIIGGTSLFGGKGTVIGSVLGALIMGMVNNGLILMGLSVDQQLILRGSIIIISVTIMMGSVKKKF